MQQIRLAEAHSDEYGLIVLLIGSLFTIANVFLSTITHVTAFLAQLPLKGEKA
jgi:hypothetical protein